MYYQAWRWLAAARFEAGELRAMLRLAIGLRAEPTAAILESRTLRSSPRSCGRLPDPEDGCGEGDDGEVVPGGLLVAGSDAPELLEPAEAVLDQVAPLAERRVEREFACS